MGARSDFLRHQMKIGRPVRPATARALIGAATAMAGREPDEWGAGVFEALAWFGLVAWFQTRGEELPDDCGWALRELADHLDPDGRRGLVAAVAPLVGLPVESSPRRVRSA